MREQSVKSGSLIAGLLTDAYNTTCQDGKQKWPGIKGKHMNLVWDT